MNGTLQVNRKLNPYGRNITFRGRFSYGDNVNKQYTESETRYFQLMNYLQTGDSTLIRNQFIHTPTKDFNYRAQLTYSEPIAKSTFLQFSYQFQYMYSESDKRTYDLYNNPAGGYYDWGIGDPLPDDYLSSEVDSLGKYAEYRYYNHDASLALRFIREKWQLSSGISLQPQHTVLPRATCSTSHPTSTSATASRRSANCASPTGDAAASRRWRTCCLSWTTRTHRTYVWATRD